MGTMSQKQTKYNKKTTSDLTKLIEELHKGLVKSIDNALIKGVEPTIIFGLIIKLMISFYDRFVLPIKLTEQEKEQVNKSLKEAKKERVNKIITDKKLDESIKKIYESTIQSYIG